ncbi:MAG TPA: c-type cytochrome, partial [Bryobacteraceae bacterium]|nr:c-type cytochrome [Bryobacteraceae bacterium]
MRILLFAAFSSVLTIAWGQSPGGRATFQSLCSGCHGVDGNGGEHAPSILPSLAANNDEGITRIIRDGVPRKGMPAFKQLPETDLSTLVAYVRTLQRRPGGRRGAPVRQRVRLTDGSELEGIALGRTGRELQLRTDDQRIHLLRRSGEQYRRVTTQADWPSMHGQLSGNRYSEVKQIDRTNVGGLGVKWVFAVPNSGRLQGT